MHLPNLHIADVCKYANLHIADVCIFHLLIQNMIKAFKFRAQAIFSLLEKTHPAVSQNLSSRIFFHYSKL